MLRTFKEFKPIVAKSAWVDASAVVIGQVEIGENVSVWPNVTIRGDVNVIKIGEGSNIQDGSVIHVTHYGSEYSKEGAATIIGEGVTIGHGAVIHGCTIKDHSLIGMGAIVLDHAIVESGVMVGAGSLVPPGKTLESGFLYVGSPVKKIRELTEKEKGFLYFTAEHYQGLSQAHQEHSKLI